MMGNEESEDDDTPSSENITKQMFTISNELVVCMSVIFYMADLALDCWVMIEHFLAHKPSSGWFIFFCILLPNLYAGYKSLQWYLRAHADNPIRTPLVWFIRIFFFPFSPLLRYYDAWKYGRQSRTAWSRHQYKKEKMLFAEYLVESAEVAMLRLFIIFLEDAPIAVLNLTELILTPPEYIEVRTIGIVTAKLFCTMTLGVVHYISCNKLAWYGAKASSSSVIQSTIHATARDTPPLPGDSTEPRRSVQVHRKIVANNWYHLGRLSFRAEVTVYVWQLLSICSRLVAYALFCAVYQPWVWLLIGIRWLIHSIWIYVDVKGLSLVNAIAFGGVYLFSYVTTSPDRQILNMIFYYGMTLSEDVIIAILWNYAAPNNVYGTGALGILFGGAIVGMMFMALYYGCFHPKHADTYLRTWYSEKSKPPINRVI